MWTNESLQATLHLRVLGRNPHTHLMLCANDIFCVVKLLDEPHRRRLMAGFIASRLARLVGLPVAEAVVVEIPEFLLRGTPDLARAATQAAKAPAKLHPATCYAGNPYGKHVVDLLPDANLLTLDNLESFAHMLALDQWSSHIAPPQAVFCRLPTSTHYSVEFINRSASFCGEKLSFRDDPRNGVYESHAVYRHVRGWESFEPFLTSLILTNPETLWQLTRTLPFGWSEEYSHELDALVEGLLRRRSLIRQLIARSRDQIPDLFPDWTRRAFMPAQGSWLQPARTFGAQEAQSMKTSS